MLFFFLEFQNLLWRKEIGADSILENYSDPEVVQKYYTGGSIGFDKTGCPIWYDPIGNIDMQGESIKTLLAKIWVCRSPKVSTYIYIYIYILVKIQEN